MSEETPLTTDEFLSIYPWESVPKTGMAAMNFLWEFQLPIDPYTLWTHLIDTSRFNRALGLPQMTYLEKNGQLHGQTVNAGFSQVWVENPWQWIAGQSIVGGREYTRGFSESVRVIYDLAEDSAQGVTCLRVYFGWLPRGWLGKTLLKLSMPWLKRQYGRVLDDIAQECDLRRPRIYERPNTALPPQSEARLTTLTTELRNRNLSTDAIDALVNFVRRADELDAHRLRVCELALHEGIEVVPLLQVCLHATRLGLLRMSWDLICPHCRGVRSQSFSLKDVVDTATCEACEVSFGADRENAVEVTFQIHPSIRKIQKVHYCAAEPAKKKHIRVQQELSPGQSRIINARLQPNRYRLRTLGSNAYTLLDILQDVAPTVFKWQGQTWPNSPLDSAHGGALRAGFGSKLELTNPSTESQVYVIEDADWTDLALRPRDVFSTHEFRDLFSHESLRAGVGLSVGNQTILFTDVVGSTRFYVRSGDPKAYATIKAHFDQIKPVIRANGGVIVKTIGDATMAAFSNPLDALKASADLQRIFPNRPQFDAIKLRISLNQGPCIAVNFDTGLDYFGTTVNLAAKLQRFSETGEVAFSQSLLQTPEISEFIKTEGLTFKTSIYKSADFDAPIPVYTWNVHTHLESADMIHES